MNISMIRSNFHRGRGVQGKQTGLYLIVHIFENFSI